MKEEAPILYLKWFYFQKYRLKMYTLFFTNNTFFSTQSPCCSTSSWIELQRLLRWWLIHITNIILRYISYLVYFYLCQGVGLFMSYLCDLLFIFSLIFIFINHITSIKTDAFVFFLHFLEYLLLFLYDNVDEESKKFSNSESSVSGCCLAFAYFFADFSLALLIKVLLMKKKCVCFFHVIFEKWLIKLMNCLTLNVCRRLKMN